MSKKTRVTKSASKKARKAEKQPELSRRQQIRLCVDTQGAEAALRLGKKLGLPDATASAYVKDWVRIRAQGKKTPEEQKEQGFKFEPWFHYSSAKAAQRAASARAGICGLKKTAFVVARNGRQYAFIPAHLAKKYDVVNVKNAA